MEYKKITQMNLCTKQEQTYRPRKQTSGYQRKGMGVGGQIRSMWLTDTNHSTEALVAINTGGGK